MHRFSFHVGCFILTLGSVAALLLAVRAVPMAIGQWIMHEAGIFLGLLVGGPLLLVGLTRTPRTWPLLWVRKLLLGLVTWAMLCGGMVTLEVQMPTEGQLPGIMAVIFAITLPLMLLSDAMLTERNPS